MKMNDETFFKSMACDDSHPLWKGMAEMIDRAEDDMLTRNEDSDITRDERADIGIAIGVVRSLRRQMADARLAGIELIKSAK